MGRKSKGRILIGVFIMALVALLIFSYAQIDLNLTLSSDPTYQGVQQRLIQLGYFNRPASTAIFVVLLTLLFTCYLGFLRGAQAGRLPTGMLLKLSVVAAILLLFSYPAFSHDVFNYIFDARMVVTHRVNPYTHTALDFPEDLWTRFMRWTHRTYPYGPTWLPLTIPFYMAGMGKFSLTLFWFKVLGAAGYLTSVLLIKEIGKKMFPEKVPIALVLFALNPLVMIESLVSAHIDIGMTAFLLVAIYLLVVKGRMITASLALLVSAGIKFVTVSVIPVWIWWRLKKVRFEVAIVGTLMVTLIATLVVTVSREVLPWYSITPLALVALLPNRRKLALASAVLSLGLLLRYAPFLLVGEYTGWVRNTRDVLTALSLVIGLPLVLWRNGKSSLRESSSV